MRRKGVQRAINGHKAILKAITQRDTDKSYQAMSKHLKMAKDDLDWAKGLGS